MTARTDLAKLRDTLTAGAAELGIHITQPMLDAYAAHYSLLLARRPRAGLTSVTDPAAAAIKHFLDCLSCLLVRDIAPGERVADIGSGGGFPGLVLAVARPEASYTLIESTEKRGRFLREAAGALHLDTVTVLIERAEQTGRSPAHRERYDLVTGRAVAPLATALEYFLPLARVGGQVLAMKGPRGERELARSAGALETLGGSVAHTHRLSLPQSMGDRTLLLIEKTAPTPDRYPRRAGMPAKRPLA